MHIELSIAKEKAKAMPKGAIPALHDELVRRLDKLYSDITVEIKAKGDDALYARGASAEERKNIETILQETWESADDWFYQ